MCLASRVTPSRIDLVDLVAHVGPLVRVAHLAHAALALAVAVSLAPSVAVVALVARGVRGDRVDHAELRVAPFEALQQIWFSYAALPYPRAVPPVSRIGSMQK